MSWDLSKLGQCPFHGHFAGLTCPLCIVPMKSIEGPTNLSDMGDSISEDRSTWWRGPENELHEIFATWLQHHEVEGVHARTDQKSTIEPGWPDFTCMKTGPDGISRVCMVEFKNRTGKLRKDQVEVIERLRAQSLPVLVTGDFAEACDFVKTHLCMGTTATTSPSNANS
jgi:hypothetical protein